MKRSIVATLLGVAAATTAYGQGAISFSNYLSPPYAQVIWTANPTLAPSGAADQAVAASLDLQFQLFYGEGVFTSSDGLTGGQMFRLSTSPDHTGYTPAGGTHGPGGYFVDIIQILPQWAAGDTYTFMYKVITDGYSGESQLWTQSSLIGPSDSPPNSMDFIPGLTVAIIPEPSSFALLGLGSLAMLALRRRS
jgi:hypothetical protein